MLNNFDLLVDLFRDLFFVVQFDDFYDVGHQLSADHVSSAQLTEHREALVLPERPAMNSDYTSSFMCFEMNEMELV